MIQTVIIDDEKNCVSLLEKMLMQHFPEIKVIATTTSPDEAVKIIRQTEPDLVFLDIEMPKKNGFEVLEATKEIVYDIIFTTAYNEYAIKAIRYSALDYLLKPIDLIELTQALQRFKSKHQFETRQQQIDLLFTNLRHLAQPYNKISIATTEGIVFIDVHDILYCEATGSYTTLYLKNNEKLLTSKTLKDFEELLHNHPFCRSHHSYIINVNEIKRYIKGDGGAVIMSNKSELPVSKRKKEDLLKKLHV